MTMTSVKMTVSYPDDLEDDEELRGQVVLSR